MIEYELGWRGEYRIKRMRGPRLYRFQVGACENRYSGLNLPMREAQPVCRKDMRCFKHALNTCVWVWPDCEEVQTGTWPYAALVYVSTPVVVLYRDHITLYKGGWKTYTTKERMDNAYNIMWGMPQYTISSYKGIWYVNWMNERWRFEDEQIDLWMVEEAERAEAKAAHKHMLGLSLVPKGDYL